VSLPLAYETRNEEGKVKRLLALLLISALTKPSAAAFFIDGYELLRNCERQNESFCVGYIAGALSASTAYQVLQEKRLFCLPDGVKLGELRAVVVNHLKRNSKKLHWDAAALVISGMRESYPAKDEKCD
jgi:hypothetical protein